MLQDPLKPPIAAPRPNHQVAVFVFIAAAVFGVPVADLSTRVSRSAIGVAFGQSRC